MTHRFDWDRVRKSSEKPGLHGLSNVPQGDDLQGLAGRVAAPDLTDHIMGRLGYQRVAEGRARRQRMGRRLARTSAVFCAMLVIAGGMHYYTLGQRAQRAGMPTIQNAVSTSFEEGTRAVSGFSRALRDMLTPQLPPAMLEGDDAGFPPFEPQRRQFDEWMPDHGQPHVSRVRWSGLL